MRINEYPLCSPKTDGTGGNGGTLDQTNATKPQPEHTSNNDDSDDEGDDDPQKEPKKAKTNDDPKEPTRGKMASVFISGFFMMIVICFIYAAWQQASLSEVKDMVIAVIGALSGLVGFVIGYYFKTNA